jgi:alpha-D-xyloside xylohydrolase
VDKGETQFTGCVSGALLAAVRSDGRPFWQLIALRYRDHAGVWHHAIPAHEFAAQMESVADSATRTSVVGPITVQVASERGAFRIECTASPDDAAEWLAVDLAAQPDERFLGFGERFDALDQRGHVVDLNVTNGASGGKAYKPIPFFISSAGYGVQLLTSSRAIIHLATADDPTVVSIRCRAASLSLRLIPGDSPAEILARYTEFAGRPELPPAWVFGPWKSRDWTTEDQAAALEDIEAGRALRLAGTVKLIDASWQSDYQSFAFHPTKFPDPAALLQRAHDEGYRVILWIAPWIVCDDPPSATYRLCAERGFFIRRRSGEVYVHRLGNSPTFVGSCLDFTNPATVAWWQGHIRRLVRLGADGFKTDFGEQIPDDAVFWDGRTGRELHNLYPRLYNQATHAALREEKHGILLARSAWDGSQAYSAIWAGDQSSDFGPATGLASVIIAGQSAGLSGFPFWASDIGGYFGTPTDELFIRWAQFGAFSPIMQTHGLGKREPWAFAPETLAIYRRYAQLHMDLLPYITTFARRAVETGLPIMRALALEFPQDAGVWGDLAEHEYCFGDRLLVASVYWGGERVRFAYLPAGAWCDFWTGAAYAGGQTVRLAAGLDTIPVLARAGSLIPLLDPSADTCLPTENLTLRVAGDDLRLWIYGGADGAFELHDGTRFAWDDARATLTITDSPVARQVAARRIGRDAPPETPRQVEDSEMTRQSGDPGVPNLFGGLAAFDPDGQPISWAATSLSGEPGYVRITLSGPGPHRITFRP